MVWPQFSDQHKTDPSVGLVWLRYWDEFLTFLAKMGNIHLPSEIQVQ